MTLATIERPNTEAGEVRITAGRREKKAGWLIGLEHRLGDLFFQTGLSGPGRLWYKESRVLSAKEKVLLDEEFMRFV